MLQHSTTIPLANQNRAHISGRSFSYGNEFTVLFVLWSCMHQFIGIRRCKYLKNWDLDLLFIWVSYNRMEWLLQVTVYSIVVYFLPSTWRNRNLLTHTSPLKQFSFNNWNTEWHITELYLDPRGCLLCSDEKKTPGRSLWEWVSHLNLKYTSVCYSGASHL